jgi:hypothetical protein
VRLIAIGYNTAGTGLTRVMNSVMRRLADRHEIHFLGIGYSGDVIRGHGLTIYPTNPKDGDVFAAFQAKALIEKIEPARRAPPFPSRRTPRTRGTRSRGSSTSSSWGSRTIGRPRRRAVELTRRGPRRRGG